MKRNEESGLQAPQPPLLVLGKQAVTECDMTALVKRVIAVAVVAQRQPTPAASLRLSLHVQFSACKHNYEILKTINPE